MKRIIEIKKVDMVMCPKTKELSFLSLCELCKEIDTIGNNAITCSLPEEVKK